MPRYRVTMGYTSNRFAATETYYTGPSLLSSDIGPQVTELLRKRNEMLFGSASWINARISQVPEPGEENAVIRRASSYPPGVYGLAGSGIELTVPGSGNFGDPNLAGTWDQARSSLRMRVLYDTDRSTMRYLAFIPDEVIRNENLGINIDASQAWRTAFFNYQAELTSGRWFIRGRDRTGSGAPRQILDWTKSEDELSLLGFVLPSAPASGIIPGNWVAINGVRRKGSDKTSYNGRWRVKAVTPLDGTAKNAYFLENSQGGDPNTIKTPGTVSVIKYAYHQILRWTHWAPAAHKRGNSYGRLPGRRLKRILLDP